MKKYTKMKVIVTTAMHPDFEKRTLSEIIKGDNCYVNITAYSNKDVNPKKLQRVYISDLPISEMIEIYNPIDGITGEEYFGSKWAYECEISDEYSFKNNYLEVMSSEYTDRLRVGNRIKELREKAGLTQSQLAEKANIKQANLARIETGKYSTGQDILSKVAFALGKRLDLI